MRTILASIVFVLFISPTWAGDFDKGLKAYINGDYASALEEWTPLAEQGNPFAQYNLAGMYDNGKGVPQDYRKAFKWYTLAAEKGVADAQYKLGKMYEKGKGVSQLDKTAIHWYTLAAEQGQLLAQVSLSSMYHNGQGVIQDYVYAHMWINIAISNGYYDNGIRQFLQKAMTPAQIEQAQALARECVKKEYKDC